MAKIIAGGDSTRLQQHIEKTTEILLDIVPDLDFSVFDDSSAAVYLTDLLETLHATTMMLQEDLFEITREAISLRVHNKLMESTLANLDSVPFDFALDASTDELMSTLESSGMAELTPDGELAWDSRITVSKGDLKPVLREALRTWIDQKLA